PLVAAQAAGHGLEPMPIVAAEAGGIADAITPDGHFRSLPCHLAEAGGMDGFFAARFRRR
ncbi:MAG: MFS transporter, partial [Rhodospirillaceae bacterium]